MEIAKLMFFFAGINMGDLYGLEKIEGGRISYFRNKTQQRCSIKVQPEALAIIEKYAGTDILLNIRNTYKNYRDFLHHFNDALKSIGKSYERGKKKRGEPLFPDISSYYFRYSWASIAAEFDVPK